MKIRVTQVIIRRIIMNYNDDFAKSPFLEFPIEHIATKDSCSIEAEAWDEEVLTRAEQVPAQT